MPIQRWSEKIWVAQLAQDPAFSEDLDDLNRKAEYGELDANLVLDLSGVEHINSSNLSQLLQLRQHMIQRSGQLRLVAPPDHVWAVFLAAGLDKVFDYASDTMTALAQLQIDS